MKSVFEFWPEIVAHILERRSIFLALDYDGVLAPIAAQPDLAILSPATQELLQRLVNCTALKVAVISGRSLNDVRAHVGIKGIVYAGNHGAEIDLGGSLESHAGPNGYQQQLADIRTQMEARFLGFQGALLEDKGLGIGLHYREMDPAEVALFHGKFADWAKDLPSALEIVHAKKMFEVRPKMAWNKGNAVWHVWQSVAPKALPICLGDDLTDEDGFRALSGQGINIYVGEERNSYAEYILASQNEVLIFLKQLLIEVETMGSA